MILDERLWQYRMKKDFVEYVTKSSCKSCRRKYVYHAATYFVFPSNTNIFASKDGRTVFKKSIGMETQLNVSMNEINYY